MAYTREETENVEVDYPIDQIWENIPNAISKLEWSIKTTDKDKHYMEIKTKGAFMSYHSTIKLVLEQINEKTTRLLIAGETPVTTITAILEFGRTRQRIELFIVTLAQTMEKQQNPTPNPKP